MVERGKEETGCLRSKDDDATFEFKSSRLSTGLTENSPRMTVTRVMWFGKDELTRVSFSALVFRWTEGVVIRSIECGGSTDWRRKPEAKQRGDVRCQGGG